MFFPVSERFCGPAIDVDAPGAGPAIGYRSAPESAEQTARLNALAFDRPQLVQKAVPAQPDPLTAGLELCRRILARNTPPAQPQPKQVEQVIAKSVEIRVSLNEDPNSCFDQILFGNGRLRGVDA